MLASPYRALASESKKDRRQSMILWEQDVAWLLIISFEAGWPLEFVMVARWSTWSESGIVAISFVEESPTQFQERDRPKCYHEWVEGRCDMS